MSDARSYVYTVLVDGVVRYIGKGSGNRVRRHLQIAKRLIKARASGRKLKAAYFHNKLAKAVLAGSFVVTSILVSGMSEQDAYDREAAEIESAPSGQLWNRWSFGGGRRFPSDEFRAAQSERQKKRFAAGAEDLKAWHKKAHTSEVYAKRSKTLKETLRARPDLVASTAKKSQKWWSDPVNNASQRDKLTAAWGMQETQAKHRAYLDSPEGRANLRAASNAHWAKVRAADPQLELDLQVNSRVAS